MTIDEQRQAIREAWEDDLMKEGITSYARAEEIVQRLLQTGAEKGAVLQTEGIPKWFIFKWVGKQPDKILLDDIEEARLTAFAPLIVPK